MSSVLVAAFISSCVLSRAYPEARLVVVRAALPLIGIAPWAGLLTFEELDLPLPAVVAGGYGRLAFARTSREAVAATARSEHRRGEDGHALSLSFGYVRSFRSRLDRPARILGALQGKACAAR